MVNRIKTVFDIEAERVAEQLRDAADAVEQGGCTAYMVDEHGDVDDGPVYKTVFIKFVEFQDE